MSSFRIRPRFERIVSGSPEEVRKLFENALEKAEVPCTGRFIYDSITLYILEDEQHYWSPQLNIYLEEDPEGTQINGTYGPRPSVWAAFFYGYAIICLAALSIGMWGIALWMLEKDASILWGVPILAALGVILYIIAQTGQKLGVEQTFTLHHFFEDVVGKRVHIH